MNSDFPTVGTLQRVKGREFAEGVVMLWITYLNTMLSLNNPMNDDQVELCSIEIVEQYYMLKFSDLVLLSRRILNGGYGKLYERWDQPTLMSIFEKYFDERCVLAEEQSIREHRDHKSNDEFNLSSNIQRRVQGSKKFK